MLLFFFVATTIAWQPTAEGFALGLLLLLVRAVVKIAVCTATARVSGISARKGALTGVAIMPLTVFAIVLIEQTRRQGVDLFDSLAPLAPLAAMAMVLEVLAPILTQRALSGAREAGQAGRNHEDKQNAAG